MRLRIPGLLTVIASVSLLGLTASAQSDTNEGDTDVRGVFMSTRPSTTPSPQQPKHTGGSSKTKGDKHKNGSGKGQYNSTHNTGLTATADQAPIALGYTIYMIDLNGDAVRVDPQREFTNGDRVRLLFEPNIDGYLYIFNMTNNEQPKMIFPDIRLKDGDNAIGAHVPNEIPPPTIADPRYRFFTFSGNGGIEHVYIVLARKPLMNVPIGRELANYCRTQQSPCTWQPSSAIWEQIKNNANSAMVRVYKDKENIGKRETKGEEIATTRGLGLAGDAPPPSVIQMDASSTTGVLVTSIDLNHK